MAPKAKRVYFFSGLTYQRFDSDLNDVPSQYPLPIIGAWPGLFPGGVDVSIIGATETCISSPGASTASSTSCGTRSPPATRRTSGRTGGHAGTGFDLGVDPAVNWGNGTSFLFKGDQYVRPGESHADGGGRHRHGRVGELRARPDGGSTGGLKYRRP
jgi:hypothetical protein